MESYNRSKALLALLCIYLFLFAGPHFYEALTKMISDDSAPLYGAVLLKNSDCEISTPVKPCCVDVDVVVNQNCQPMTAGYNAPAPVNLNCCQKGFLFWFSFLYWQPEQNFMDIAFESDSVIRNNACGFSWKHGDVIEMDSSFQPGFKVGVDYLLPCFDYWDISAEYTHLHTKNSKGAMEPSEGFLYARWIQPNLISNNSATRICDSWQLNFNVLNIDIGRRCYIGERFITRPYIGVATAWISQKFKADIELISPLLLLKVTDSSSCWAIGPRIGIDGNWYFTNCFSLVGNIATDIFFTHYQLKLHQHASNDDRVCCITL